MIDSLTLDQMRVFAAVADAGSFRGGAQRLHRVQSAVSHAIANLEAQLGVALFDRSAYKPKLTPAGMSLLAEVRMVLAKVDALRARARELQQGVELQLSLAVDTLFPPDLIAEALTRMHERYPNVSVRVEFASLGGTLDALMSKRCTLAVSALDWKDDRITRRFLMPVSTVAVVASSHPLARMSRKSAAEQERLIAEHVQIVVEDKTHLTQGRDFGVLSPRTWKVDDMSVKLALLRAGLGWGSLPACLVEADLASGRLVRLPASSLGPDGEVSYLAYLSHRTDQALGPAAHSFAEHLVRLAAEAPRHSGKRRRHRSG